MHVSSLHLAGRKYFNPLRSEGLGRIPVPPTLIGLPGNQIALRDGMTFTLTPSHQPLDLRAVQEPFSPPLRSLLEHGGYEVLRRARRSEHEVLVNFEGSQPSLTAFKSAVNMDGKSRGGLHWAHLGRQKGFREINLPRHLAKGLVDSANSGTNDEEASDAELVRSYNMEKWAQRAWRRFIMSFQDDAEAKRFVNAWHRRDITALLNQEGSDERTIINVELIW